MNILSGEGVNLPQDVYNSIEDVFAENDNINNAFLYFKNNLEDLQNDLTFKNVVTINLSGETKGEKYDHYTYYGEIDFADSEDYKVYKDGNELYKLSDYNPGYTAQVLFPEEYAVVLVEKVNFDNSGLNINDDLYIYCPQEELSEEDYKYQGIYNQIKESE